MRWVDSAQACELYNAILCVNLQLPFTPTYIHRLEIFAWKFYWRKATKLALTTSTENRLKNSYCSVSWSFLRRLRMQPCLISPRSAWNKNLLCLNYVTLLFCCNFTISEAKCMYLLTKNLSRQRNTVLLYIQHRSKEATCMYGSKLCVCSNHDQCVGKEPYPNPNLSRTKFSVATKPCSRSSNGLQWSITGHGPYYTLRINHLM